MSTNAVLLCEGCPAEIATGTEIKVKTSKGNMVLCHDCAAKPENVSVEEEKPKKLTQEELFKQFQNDEHLKIAALDFSAEGNGQALLIERFHLLESIVFEAKTRASAIAGKLRKIEFESGKNRWDKNRGEEVPGNFSDPRTNNRHNKPKKAELSKLEKLVAGFLELGYTEDEVLDAIPEGKFKGIEVRDALTKLKG